MQLLSVKKACAFWTWESTYRATSQKPTQVTAAHPAGIPFAVYDTYQEPGWFTLEGTSAGTPQWAALVAIADQGRALAGEGTLDGATQTLPAIYQMPSSDFHDITTGNNGAYSAGPGYDLVTGRGTPITNLVVGQLVSWGASAGTPVDLSASYDRTGIVTDGTTFSNYQGLDEAGHSLSANLLGTSISWNGLNFNLGPANANDDVAALGQTITLPQGYYSSLNFLATTAYNAEPNMTFTVKYTDGTTQNFTQSLSEWTVPQNFSGESVAKSMSYRDKYDGTQDQVANDTYAYSIPLNSGKQVQSITLPANQGNINILAMTLSPASAGTPVDLSASYDRVGIVTDGTTFPSSQGMDEAGHSLSANLLGSAVAWNGLNFNLGPANANDDVAALGQTITLPQGYYSTLNFLATTAYNAEPNMTFTVKYTDGTTQTFTQSFSEWTSPQNFSGESVAKSMSYRDKYDGTQDPVTNDIYAYSIPLNSGKEVQSITLPANQGNINILAMTLQ